AGRGEYGSWAIGRSLSSGGPRRLENHELRGGADLLDVAEQPLELVVIAQVAVADDPQLAALAQRGLGLGEHAPGEEIADHLLLMEGRVAQHKVQRGRRLFGQAVAGADLERAIAMDRLPVLLD